MTRNILEIIRVEKYMFSSKIKRKDNFNNIRSIDKNSCSVKKEKCDL